MVKFLRFPISKYLLFLLLLPLSFSGLAQQMDLRGNSEYTAGQCPANDVQIIGAEVDLGSVCNDCSPGDLITADILITIQHNTNSSNRYLAVMGDLTETFSGGGSAMSTFTECSGPLDKSNDPSGGLATYNYGQITFTCGSELVLDNILLVWTAAMGECPVTPENNPNGKYCYANPTINITPPLNAMAVASCTTGNNVDVDLTVQGGVMPFTYAWSNGATTEDLSNVAPGTYSVVATGADGCTATTSITVGPVLASSSTKTDVLCFGESTGSIDLTVTGGVTPYIYSWDNGAVTEDLSGLSVGTYIVTVTDALGCEITESITIDEPTELSCSVVQDNPASNGNSDGEATVTPAGGTAPYTYSWDNSETTQTATALSGGLHTVTVTDANGCETTCQVTIEELDPLECTVSLESDVACNGESSGSATVTPTGGVSPFGYSWDNGEITQTATALDAGLHTVTVTDANGAQTSCDVTIGEPDELTSSTTQVDVLCFGDGTGSADLTVSGGMAPYTYQWSNGATTQDLSGLTADTYNVTITDANGCETTDSVTIIEPTDLTCSVALDSGATINGASDGAATVTPSGGTAPYGYSWDNGETTQQATGLDAGLHTVTVTDANGCETTCEVTVTEPDVLTCSVALVQDEQCFGDEDGSATANPVGGVGPYTYAWGNGETTQTATGLSQGLHTVTVTDANGAETMCDITIGGPSAALSCSIILDSGVTVNGASDGSATVTALGGTTAYSYLWDNGETTQQATGLDAGLHTVTVTDANGCETTCEVTVTEPDVLTCSVALESDVACNSENNGSATVTPTGGVSPFSYDWDNGETTQTATALSAGLHMVTVTDANGAETTCEVTIGEPDELTSSTTQVDVLCFDDATGSADLTVSGGTAPYTYSWSNGTTTEDISGLTAGTYSVLVVDANGCETTDMVTIVEPDAALTASSTKVDVLCFGDATGSINLTVSGGTTDYTFLWSTGATTEDLSGLTAGSYEVTITDANGCETTDSVTINEPAMELMCSVALDMGVSVNGASDGAATVTATGGTLAYAYLWDNGETTQSATALNAGLHTVTVTDANGCETTCEVTIPEPDQLVCNVSLDANVNCNGDSDGTATVTPMGGVAPYTYVWDNGETTQTATSLNSGLHSVTVTDANGAETSCEVTVSEPAELTCSVMLDSGVTINGASDGTATVAPNGGTAPYTYSWDNGETTQQATALNAGLHTVTVIDANGCETVCDVMVTEPDALSCDIDLISDTTCNSGDDGSATTNPIGGVAPFTYLWDNGETGMTATMLTAGLHTVMVTDANGAQTSCEITISEPEPPNAGDENMIRVCDGTLVDLTTLVSEMGGSFSDPAMSGGLDGTDFDTTDLGPGTYDIIYTVEGATADCPVDTATITVIVDELADAGEDNETTVCDGELVDLTTLVSVMGGAFTDPGLSGGLNGSNFDTTGLSPGSYELTYTVGSGNQNCPDDSAKITIHVDAPVDAGADNSTEVCESTIVDLSALVSVPGGTFSDPGMTGGLNGNSFDTSGLTPGNYDIVYTVPSGNTCPNDTAMITVMVLEDIVTQSCEVLDIDFCNPNEEPFYNLFWFEMPPETRFFSQDDTHNLSFTEFTDGTALIEGSTQVGTCSAQVYIVLKDLKDWTQWSGDGGMFKPQGCDPGAVVKENLRYYIIDETQSTITTTGGDCVEQGTFIVSQRPDPNDLNTPNLGVHIGPGGALYDSDTSAEGLAGWGWMGPQGDEQRYRIDFNFHIDCKDETGCEPQSDLECTIDSSSDDATCFGANDGSATVSASGGVGPYTYLWDNGETTATATMLTAGSHSVVVYDADGNKTDCSVEIEQPEELTCETKVLSEVSANGANDGSATVVPDGGTAPYTYLWDNGETVQNAIMLSAGTHSVKILDANGCETVCYVDIPDAGQLSCYIRPESGIGCYGDATGGALVVPTGGVPPYTYLWDNGETTQIASMLSAGLREVTVTDANGSETTCSFTLESPEELTCSAAVFSNVSSNGGSDGSATATPMGGTGPFTYLWDNGETTSMAIALDAGVHMVTITDVIGCETSCEVTVMQPDLLSCTAEKMSDALCNDSEDGSAQVIINGGTPPYSYSWDNGEITQTALALSAGQHTVTVTDANGSETTCNVTIKAPSELQATASLVSDVTINGASDGSASVTANGGTPPYTYLWDNGETTQTAIMLAAGLHTVKVTDANGCEVIAEVMIPTPDALMCSTLVEKHVLCMDESDGSATVTPTGGVGPYTYLWDNGEMTQTAAGLNAGMHSVTVTDANGAETSCDITIEEPMELTATASEVNATSGAGEEDGVATVSANGGTPPYTYLWDNGETTQMASMLSAGMHTVTVTDANGCTAETSVAITERNAFSCVITLVNHVSCFGGADGSATVTPMGGMAPYIYEWSSTGETDPTAVSLAAGVQWVTIRDANGRESACQITIEEPPQLTCEIVDVIDSDEGEDNGEATVAVGGGVGPFSFLWNDTSGQTTQTATGLAPGTYLVTVTDQNACETQCEVTIDEIPAANPTGCETAFARYEPANTCFIDDGFNRWGWTNYFDSEGSYTMDLFAGAGQCDISKGEKSGEVSVEYSNGSVRVSIELLAGFIMQEAQLYVGTTKYPTKGNGMPTVAPGQYPINSGTLDNLTTYEFDAINVSGTSGGLYIIVHAVTCNNSASGRITRTAVTPYPMTFKDELNLSIDIPYATKMKVEMFDVNGRCVMTKENMNIKAGTNDVRLNVSSIAPDMYFLVIDTGKERIVKKVMSRK